MKNLLREYIQEYFLKFRGFDNNDETIKPSNFLRKINSFFGGGLTEIVSEWIEDAEDIYDIAVDDKMQRSIEDYVKRKYPAILKKTRGDEEKARAMTKRLLDFKYLKSFTDLEKESS